MPVELVNEKNALGKIIPIDLLSPERLAEIENTFSTAQKNWLTLNKFSAKPGESLLLVDETGNLDRVLLGKPGEEDAFSALDCGKLTEILPDGCYRFSVSHTYEMISALSFLLNDYQFSQYKTLPNQKTIKLVIENDEARLEAQRLAEGAWLSRDLVNTPTNDMGPEQLSKAIQKLATTHNAQFNEIVGEALLEENFPLIHAVGRASSEAPRLIDMVWGNETLPKVTLVGKGVCFDTGGLNIKTGNFMTLMKKDMGGASNVLGLAAMIMDAKLPIRLRVLIPAVENAIAGNAFRPGDVLPSRAGINVEISNTDAEGRLVLADALALADEEAPELLIDMATLTGAARVALGPDIVPFYSHDDGFSDEIQVRSKDMADPIWRMPLWSPYQTMLDSSVADVNHASASGFAGSITAALFLSRFVKKAAVWSHFDIYAWNPKSAPAKPMGGEAQAIRALYALIKARYK